MCKGNIRGEGRDKGIESMLETITNVISPKLMSDTKPQLQEPQKTPSRISDEGNKQTKEQMKIPPRDTISNCKKSRIKKKSRKESEGKNHQAWPLLEDPHTNSST